MWDSAVGSAFEWGAGAQMPFQRTRFRGTHMHSSVKLRGATRFQFAILRLNFTQNDMPEYFPNFSQINSRKTLPRL